MIGPKHFGKRGVGAVEWHRPRDRRNGFLARCDEIQGEDLAARRELVEPWRRSEELKVRTSETDAKV